MTTEQDLTREMDPSPFLGGEVDTAEHSRNSKAKKVVIGPLWVPKHASQDRTVEIIDISGASTTLGLGKAFRIISDGSFFYRQSVGSGTGDTSKDIYVPKDTAVIISTRFFDTICVSGKTGSFVQAVEVQ